jgi:DNA-binding NarL/FixJ family response regulator
MGTKKQKVDIDVLISEMTEQEIDIMNLQAQGFVAKEIADKLKIATERIVENITFALCKKFGAKNKTNLIAILTKKEVINIKV